MQPVRGHLSFVGGVDHPLLRALPPYLLISAEPRARSSWLGEVLRLIARQMFSGSSGVTASTIWLSEALFNEVIRACAGQDQKLQAVIGDMGDARIGRALSLMHRDLLQD